MRCSLCEEEGGRLLWRDALCRVVRPEVEGYPGFCRVILNRHVAEMTDLAEGERAQLMRVVYACEQALRELLRPDKINLASLGNQVPHLHWHVIARFREDAHFPEPIWAAPQRAAAPPSVHIDDRRIAGRLRTLLGASESVVAKGPQ